MNSLNSNLDALFSKMENFVTSKTVVGEPTKIGEVIILPLVDLVFGVGAGASDKSDENDKKSIQSGGGGGLGAKITPSAVLVISGGEVQLVNVKNQDSLNKLIDMVPEVLNKFNFGKTKKDKYTEMDMDDLEKTIDKVKEDKK